MKHNNILWISLALALFLLAFSLPVMGMTRAPDQAVVMPGEKPDFGRPAPYGQYFLTHNDVVVTTTGNYGTAAQTAGYDRAKVLICDNVAGGSTAEVDLYGSISSGGGLHLLTNDIASVSAGTSAWITFTHQAPWMTVAITSAGTSTMTCALWTQTP